jgi:hypothetical protein
MAIVNFFALRVVFHPNNASGSGHFKKERKKGKPGKKQSEKNLMAFTKLLGNQI